MGVYNPNYADRIAKRLTELRTEYNRNITETADFLDIERKQYSDYEKGKQPPSIFTLEKIANKYNVSVDYLLNRSDCRSVDNGYIQEQTGLSDDAIECLKKWHHDPDRYSVDSCILDMLLACPDDVLTEYFFKNVFKYVASDYYEPILSNDVKQDESGKTFNLNGETIHGENAQKILDNILVLFGFTDNDGKKRAFYTNNALEFTSSIIRTNCIDEIRGFLDAFRQYIKDKE